MDTQRIIADFRHRGFPAALARNRWALILVGSRLASHNDTRYPHLEIQEMVFCAPKRRGSWIAFLKYVTLFPFLENFLRVTKWPQSTSPPVGQHS